MYLSDDYSQSDWAWLSGLLEGEGWFGSAGTGGKSPRVRVQMTDQDVMERVAKMFSVKCRLDHRFGMQNRKPIWRAEVGGDRAVVIMNRILPQMGKRRTERIMRTLLRAKLRMPRQEIGRRWAEATNTKIRARKRDSKTGMLF